MTKIIFRSNFFSFFVIEQPAATREMQEKALPCVRPMLGETQQKESSGLFLFFVLYQNIHPVAHCSPVISLKSLRLQWAFPKLLPLQTTLLHVPNIHQIPQQPVKKEN